MQQKQMAERQSDRSNHSIEDLKWKSISVAKNSMGPKELKKKLNELRPQITLKAKAPRELKPKMTPRQKKMMLEKEMKKREQTILLYKKQQQPKILQRQSEEDNKMIKLKLIKCCVCLKKISDDDYFQCKKHSCKKKYHFSCMDTPNNCSKCRLQQKMLPHSQIFKIQEKEKVNLQKEMIWNSLAISHFRRKYPHYFASKTQLLYPIPDELFFISEYSFLKQKNTQKKPLPKPLPSHFGTTIEIWNFIFTFRSTLKITDNLNIEEIYTGLLTGKMYTLVIKLIIMLLDNLKEKLCQFSFFQLLYNFHSKDYLQEILKLFWPKVLFELINRNLEFFKNENLKRIVEKKVQKRSFTLNQKYEQNYELLNGIILMIKDSKKREDLGGDEKKIFKNELLAYEKEKSLFYLKKKSLEIQIQEKEQLLKKIKRDSNKFRTKKEESEKQTACEEHRKKFEEIITLRQNIHKLTCLQDIFMTCLPINFIGLDKDGCHYWLLQLYPDKIFVQKEGNWGYYTYKDIQQLLNSLNKRGCNENNLYQILKVLYEAVLEKEKKFPLKGEIQKYEPGKLLRKEITQINYKQFKNMMVESEKIVTEGLSLFGGWWGPQAERKKFVQCFENPSFTKTDEIKNILKDWGEKIHSIYLWKKNKSTIRKCACTYILMQAKFWGMNNRIKDSWVKELEESNNFYSLFLVGFFLYVQSHIYGDRPASVKSKIVQQNPMIDENSESSI